MGRLNDAPFAQKKVTGLYLHVHYRLLRLCQGWDGLYWHNQGDGGTSSMEVHDHTAVSDIGP